MKKKEQILKKVCKYCGTIVTRDSKYSYKQWGIRKFCSNRCSRKGTPHNGILTIEKRKKAFLENNPMKRKEVVEKFSGSSSHLWKGGITPINQLLRSRMKFRNWRKRIFERDGYTCSNCGERGCYLNADHIKPFAYFPKLRYKLSNGRTLCVPCHKDTPTYGQKGRTLYE